MSQLPRRLARRIAGICAAAGLSAVAVLTVPGGTALAQPGPAPIGPGVQIVTPLGDGAELCTANFLFTGAGGQDGHRDGDGAEHQSSPAGKLYLGTAAHCTGTAESTGSVDGCVEPVMPEGTEVGITGRDGRSYSGTVAYNSWAAMQARGETDRAACGYNDFALIELSPEAAAVADPTVPGFGGPVALDTDGTRNGETVYSHQPNQLAATPDKQGISLGRPEGPRTHVVVTAPPGVPGDSGSGYLDSEGKAFGVLSSLLLPTAANGVADIAQALDYAAEYGRIGKVDLVPGTAPFAPDTLRMTELPAGPQLPAQPLPDLTPAPLR
ncbi:hypothetical protein Ae168Ps1_2275c [Pseudonocardia sp. Ae168_Ps1]|uniref:trypsin-like peptidase domain-containing protein n=1 Tax=unclassified Pseudonocardia TaxID=2619320 RepID=UPI0001FFEACC|nr:MULTISPECIES: trypsin-like peptidase domain-containing protein [unclassified Pseudonocardia]OLL73890.1 hypothetical protein Ae150APs1_2268c [Pseudonocardia sp. Ae150A_Ps1]OLL79869.1 hypothetical protein Ae168Ps1_2275c [Pseudonocardia sp. Ae168_Ps1]OLL85998.1 hypothetical protein Ae263Ps1_3053 [Pseudonocardia sp. Ae263_Ps1]OLL93971.1 hypothetical protein Ae356Ps1_3868c [Pseudonocardia sp. Ae356_Ps1]OLM20492.1 hypothetical protein Ae707Ps1_4751c [Pseudonocardia sp. Ae707_Ps1]